MVRLRAAPYTNNGTTSWGLGRGAARRPDLDRVVGQEVEPPGGLRDGADDGWNGSVSDREPLRLCAAADEVTRSYGGDALVAERESGDGVGLERRRVIGPLPELQVVRVELVAGDVDVVVEDG